MDIYIDKRRMYLEMQHRHRKFIARNICTECSFERALSRCVTDISAVEKEALSVAVLAYKLGRTDKAVYLYSVAQCADGNEIIRAFSAHYRIYRAAQIAVSGCTVAQLSVADKRYGYLGMGKRSLFHYSGHCLRLAGTFANSSSAMTVVPLAQPVSVTVTFLPPSDDSSVPT